MQYNLDRPHTLQIVAYFPEQTPFIHLHVFSAARQENSLHYFFTISQMHINAHSRDTNSLGEIPTFTFKENEKTISTHTLR